MNVEAAQTCDRGSETGQAVRSVATGIIDADNARDIERVLSYYAEDAILMPPGEQPVSGREDIRPRYESLFASFNPAIEARVDEVCVEDQLAFVRGHNGGKLVARDGSGEKILDDAYLMVLKRDDASDWHISHLMWHPAGSGSLENSE